MACKYCGAVLQTPKGVEDELAMVREQASAAQQIAVEKGNGLMNALGMGHGARMEKWARLADFWSTAFVPTTPPALVAALNLCVAGVPHFGADTADSVAPLLHALAARADLLASVLNAHEDATVQDRAAAERVAAVLAARVSHRSAASRRMWLLLLAPFVVMLVVPVLFRVGSAVMSVVVQPIQVPTLPPMGVALSAEPAPPAANSASVAAAAASVGGRGGASRPAASAGDTGPKPVADDASSPLDQLAASAKNGASFKVASDDAWALYPPGTSDCGTDSDGHVIRLDVPHTSDEFEFEKLKSAKKEIAGKYMNAVVAFRGSGNAADRGFDVDDFHVALGKYNFTTHQYPLTISCDEKSKWPLTGVMPKLGFDTVAVKDEQEIAKLGGKSLTVEGQHGVSVYGNRSSMVVPLAVPVDEAEAIKSSAPTELLIVMRFTGLGYHKVCQTECGEVFGVRTCSGMNTGFEMFYKADLLGYRVTVAGKTVAEKQPPAAALKK